MPLNDVQHLSTDVLIIGGGVAGMMAAVGALRAGVTPSLVTKDTYASGSSSMARGGHSVAIGHSSAENSPELFFEDTIAGGFGLNNRRLAVLMCTESIDRTSSLALGAWDLPGWKTAATTRRWAHFRIGTRVWCTAGG